MTKHQIIEEPCVVKVSSTVLKTNGFCEELVEFNKRRVANLYQLRKRAAS